MDKLSNSDRTKWDFFLEMGVTEFLNYMAFFKDKNAYENSKNGRNNI